MQEAPTAGMYTFTYSTGSYHGRTTWMVFNTTMGRVLQYGGLLLDSFWQEECTYVRTYVTMFWYHGTREYTCTMMMIFHLHAPCSILPS